MVWQAANLSKKRNREKQQRQNEIVTIEASLSQLNQNYSNVMECLGAWYKAGKQQKQSEVADDSQKLAEVGRAARGLMETTLLPDALVVPHLANLRREDSQSASKIELTSNRHRQTVQQIAYLTVVNYADLLVAGCGPVQEEKAASSSTHLLDQGLIPPLPALASSCWMDEAPVETFRIALHSLLDAVGIDGSDPMVWLKLACLARKLGKSEGHVNQDYAYLPFRYARLERHALHLAEAMGIDEVSVSDQCRELPHVQLGNDHPLEAFHDVAPGQGGGSVQRRID